MTYLIKTFSLVLCYSMVFCLLVFSQQYSIVEKDSARSLIPDIERGFLDNEVVTIEGYVTRWEHEEYRTTILYWLRNYWGDVIVVRTPDGHPEVNKPYRVTGTVSVFTGRDQRRFLDERRRSTITDREAEARSIIDRVAQVVRETDDKWWLDASSAFPLLMEARRLLSDGDFDSAITRAQNAEQIALNAPYANLLYLVGAGGIILIGLIITLVVVLVRRPESTAEHQPAAPTETVPKEESVPEPSKVAGGETIKIHQPPPQTLKVLPGKFEVIAGDPEIKEIRLFKLPGQTDGEYSFGRNPGPAYRHIQIKHPTVSREQAKLLFNNGKYTIVNRADPDKSNATMLNENGMGINELHELKDGDRITMGIVTMVFRNN